MKRINIYITETQHKQFNQMSDETGLSASEHIRRALDEYMQKYKLLVLSNSDLDDSERKVYNEQEMEDFINNLDQLLEEDDD